MTTVYIAEKPDIATAIASYLWSDYSSCKGSHSYKKTVGNDEIIVTWAFGHILATAMPDAYGEEYASFTKYSIIPKVWKKYPSPSSKEQFNYIKSILKKANVVIHGGDPDREGQLLVDEILDFVQYRGEVKRVLINAKDNNSMKRAFETIVPNANFRNLYEAGMARERADWLVGMNLSRAYTANARKNGFGNVWRIGRVKIPTLSLVVTRERELQNFHPVDFFVLVAKYSKDGVPFTATLVPDENTPTDSEGRIISLAHVRNISNEVIGKDCNVVRVECKSSSENAPLPYSLDTLQVEANRKYGMSPKSVLDTVQSLYEKKYVSYPRSDCNYIPSSQHTDAGRILKALEQYGMQSVQGADTSIMSKAYNDKKVSAHHAIIPTGVKPNNLNEREKKIYTMIAMRYIVQFFPACKFDTVKYCIECKGHMFSGSGKVITSPGWKSVSKGEEAEDSQESLPSLPPISQADILKNAEYEIESKQTQPPKRFTEGSLLAAMTNIWRYMSHDNPNREKLKECKGLGTPATRDTIISELMASKSGKSQISPCIEKKGKELVPTAFGIGMIERIHESLTKPDLTAVMEYNLSSIADGKMSLEEFMEQTKQMVLDNIDYAESSADKLCVAFIDKNTKEQAVQNETCPICKGKTLERKYSPKKEKHFWVCNNKCCVHPSTGKAFFYDDFRKKPLVKLCPQCGVPLNRVQSRKNDQYYWFCPKCNEFKKMK